MARAQTPNSLAHAANRHYKENQSFLSRGAADTGTTLFRFSPIQFDSTYRLRLSPSLGEEEVPMTITSPTWHFCVLAWATSIAHVQAGGQENLEEIFQEIEQCLEE